MVGRSWCAASVASTKRKLPCGSSNVLSRALAEAMFKFSAGNTRMAFPRPRPLVSSAKATAERTSSMRISLDGLRFLSSISFCAFSGNGQPSESIRVSGMSTTKSVWLRARICWQLAHTPHAPCPLATRSSWSIASHNQLCAIDSANSY